MVHPNDRHGSHFVLWDRSREGSLYFVSYNKQTLGMIPFNCSPIWWAITPALSGPARAQKYLFQLKEPQGMAWFWSYR